MPNSSQISELKDILVSFIKEQKTFNKVVIGKFEQIDEKFAQIDKRFEQIDKKIDKKFNILDKKIDEKFNILDKKIDKKFDILDKKINKVDNSLNEHIATISEYIFEKQEEMEEDIKILKEDNDSLTAKVNILMREVYAKY